MANITPMQDEHIVELYWQRSESAIRKTAASYIEIVGAGAAAPPDEIIDFILDRPFVFAVTKSQIPLFLGTVNRP
ncbi:MAG: hypothetical protein IJD06_06810 [Clostridia bacterium]|nr:hypothetical protein [Clostridia bacterium]